MTGVSFTNKSIVRVKYCLGCVQQQHKQKIIIVNNLTDKWKWRC